jgi:hypothetical protein
MLSVLKGLILLVMTHLLVLEEQELLALTMASVLEEQKLPVKKLLLLL